MCDGVWEMCVTVMVIVQILGSNESLVWSRGLFVLVLDGTEKLGHYSALRFCLPAQLFDLQTYKRYVGLVLR